LHDNLMYEDISLDGLVSPLIKGGGLRKRPHFQISSRLASPHDRSPPSRLDVVDATEDL